MEKEFIPYEQALALKELGFNRRTLAQYNTIQGSKWILTFDLSGEDQCVGIRGACIAPTFSQAFRWFREKYGLSSCINLKMQNSKRIIWYNICELDNRLVKSMYFKNNSKGFFKSHEEAEIKCLKKLIKIVKTKETC